MKHVRLVVTWQTQHVFLVEDDWQVPDTLDGFTETQLDEMDTSTAELTDWDLV